MGRRCPVHIQKIVFYLVELVDRPVHIQRPCATGCSKATCDRSFAPLEFSSRGGTRFTSYLLPLTMDQEERGCKWMRHNVGRDRACSARCHRKQLQWLEPLASRDRLTALRGRGRYLSWDEGWKSPPLGPGLPAKRPTLHSWNYPARTVRALCHGGVCWAGSQSS